MPEEEIGVITHYYGHIQVAGIKIERGKLQIGDRIHVLGHTSDFEQTIESMQVEHAAVEEAGPGDDVGVKVVDHAREHDKVFKVTD
jgi:putative protease